MGFGAPLALLLLTAVSLPWLVHRMRQRDLPTVKLPTIALLQRAMAVTQRRRALEDLLLMLTRMALICVLAFALAAPYWWRASTFGSGQPLSLAIVIDDSMSMQRAGSGVGSGSLINQALERAREVIGSLPSGSQVALIAAGRPPRTLASLGTQDAALQAISSIDLSPARGTEVAHAIQLADSALSAAAHAQRQVLVLSDFAGTARPPNHYSGVDVRYEQVGDDARADNVAVVAAKATRDDVNAGAFALHVDLSATSAATGSQRSITLEVHSDSALLSSVNVPIQGAHARIDLPLRAEQARGLDHVRVRVADNDALSVDNERAVLLQDTRDRHLLLVNGDPRPTHSSDELHFLSRALPLAPRETTQLSILTTDAIGVPQAPLDAVDIIWLANVDAPSAATSARLIEFVRSGGSLIVSAGDRVQAAAYNAQLGELLPGRIEGIETRAPIDLDLANAGADAWGIATASVGHVNTRQRLIVQAAQASGVALRYSDGAPALLRHSVGRGRVALWTTSIDGDWTDLPFVPGFVALTTSLVQALAPHAATAQVVEPGTPQRVAIASSTEATLIDPQQHRHALRIDGRYAWVAAERTLLPGAYKVEAVDDNGVTRDLPRAAFVVAPPIDESDLAKNALPTGADDAEAESAPTRVQQPFDMWLFAWAMPLFLLEALLRTRRRQRSAQSPHRPQTDAPTPAT